MLEYYEEQLVNTVYEIPPSREPEWGDIDFVNCSEAFTIERTVGD